MTINNYYIDQPTNKFLINIKTLLMFLEYFSTILKTTYNPEKKCFDCQAFYKWTIFHCHTISYEFVIFYYSYKHIPFSFFLNGLVTFIGLLVRLLLERWRGCFCMLPSDIWKVLSDSG